MTRRIVFAGGVQAQALARAYRSDAAADRDEDVVFVGGEAELGEAALRAIAAADIVVTEATEAGEAVPERLLQGDTERIVVPVAYGDFLWPYAGHPHPRRSVDAFPDGPYPADFGDAFLDSMLARHVPEDEAVRRYLAFDVAGTVDLDALLDDTLAKQALLDARTGFELADFVATRFRLTSLFATRERLHLPLFQHLAATVFDRLGAGAAHVREAPFAPGEMPIHPAVLLHFGLAAPLPDHRYAVPDEGCVTFEAYCRRYLRYGRNEALHTPPPTGKAGGETVAAPDSPTSVPGPRALPSALHAATALAGPGAPAAEMGLAGLKDSLLSTDLPSMAPSSALSDAGASPFAAMPEIMPPPPLRPVLPAEAPTGPVAERRGFVARLFGRRGR